MSKLSDKLRDLSKPAVPAMGFQKTGAEEKKTTFLVAVDTTGRAESEIKEIAGLGVGIAVVNSAGLSAAAFAKALKACQGMVTGLYLNNGKAFGSKGAGDDVDFVICNLQSPVTLYGAKELENLGRVVCLEASLEVSQLRAVNGLYPEADAALVEISADTLTLEVLLGCRKVAEHSGLPVITIMRQCLSEAELVALREAGVRGLLLSAGMTAGGIKDCLEIIASLPKPAARKEKVKNSVSLLPHLSAAGTKKEESDEDEDDD